MIIAFISLFPLTTLCESHFPLPTLYESHFSLPTLYESHSELTFCFTQVSVGVACSASEVMVLGRTAVAAVIKGCSLGQE